MTDDLISRQAAIRKYQEVCNEIKCGECPFLIKVNTEKGSHLITDCKLEAFLYNLPSAQQWIPVTKRLPDPYSGEYLVTINDGSVYTDILWFDSPGDGRYESCFYKTDADGYGVACDDVIAWMPLPEAYKGENDG